MKEERYENFEWFLSSFLLGFSCVGMTFFICWVWYLISDALSVSFVIAAFLVCLVLTWVLNELRLEMRYRHLLIKAQREEETASLTQEQREQAEDLYEHLTVR